MHTELFPQLVPAGATRISPLVPIGSRLPVGSEATELIIKKARDSTDLLVSRPDYSIVIYYKYVIYDIGHMRVLSTIKDEKRFPVAHAARHR